MKKIFYIVICALAAIAVSSCQKVTTEGVTGITYYATITLEGETYMVLQKGTAYEEPGYSAVLKGEDCTDQVTVTSNVNMDKSGAYSISYSYTNVDGFTASAYRTVIVMDLSDPIEGFYMTSAESYRLNSAGTKTVYGAPYEIAVYNNGDGTYNIDDILGGYYCQKIGYGDSYKCGANVSITDGVVALIDSSVPGWGDSAASCDGTFDEATSTFEFCTNYAKMEFYVTMTKE